MPQAITQQRRALALREQLPNPSDRAISHGNLANYLEHDGTPPALAESARHQLATLLYRPRRKRLKQRCGPPCATTPSSSVAPTRPVPFLAIPRAGRLLANPAFSRWSSGSASARWTSRSCKTAVDQFLEQARQAALSQE